MKCFHFFPLWDISFWKRRLFLLFDWRSPEGSIIKDENRANQNTGKHQECPIHTIYTCKSIKIWRVISFSRTRYNLCTYAPCIPNIFKFVHKTHCMLLSLILSDPMDDYIPPLPQWMRWQRELQICCLTHNFVKLLKIFTAIVSHFQSNVELLCFNVADLQVPPVVNQERKSDDTLCCGMGMYGFKCYIKNFHLLILFSANPVQSHTDPGRPPCRKNPARYWFGVQDLLAVR